MPDCRALTLLSFLWLTKATGQSSAGPDVIRAGLCVYLALLQHLLRDKILQSSLQASLLML